MKERPILFSGPMVRAILAVTKTQTRRVIKPVHGFERHNICKPDMMADPWMVWWHGDETDRVGIAQECPYGKPGDRLWVRETWQKCTGCNGGDRVLFRADCEHVPAHPWKPSIFLPRKYSRITLEITGVRVERLQEIKEDDVLAEGITQEWDYEQQRWMFTSPDGTSTCPIEAFAELWDSINAKKHPWENNPFVWVISFHRIAWRLPFMYKRAGVA